MTEALKSSYVLEYNEPSLSVGLACTHLNTVHAKPMVGGLRRHPGGDQKALLDCIGYFSCVQRYCIFLKSLNLMHTHFKRLEIIIIIIILK